MSRTPLFRPSLTLALLALLLPAVPAAAQPIGGDIEMDARPGPPGSIILHAEDNWGHSSFPTLRSIERDGSVIRVYMAGEPDGASVSTPYRLDTVIDALPPDTYTVELYLADGLESEPILAATDTVTVEWACRHFEANDDNLLCLHGGRFRVRAWYRFAGGIRQEAHAYALTPDSGAFWFFRNDNLELFIKVLDGCSAFDRFWVFAAGLTDRGVEIEVVDTFTQQTWTHTTQPGEGFEAVRDTDAFATCDP